ncbi:MAG TPA: hypothetical protein ENH12_07190, partial [Proteobacteria bacterium]|nr:hypothetical protein [Pseudomonadota bacterium]
MTGRLSLIIYFTLLFLVLVILILPTFSNPPHVDYWEAFFTFHQVRADPDLSVWPYVVNHDPWRHGTFRPLLYTILYFEHRAFGSSFVWNHLTNFFSYCLLLLLLFCLGKRLGARAVELAGLLAVFAVLYSHCDILSLTFHISLIFGFCALTAGFIFYLGYLKNGKCRILFAVGFLFLLGMLCYETFCFWPPAILILFFRQSSVRPARRHIRPTLIMLGIVYSLYGSVFILTRSASYLSGELPSPAIISLPIGVVFSLFNLLYTGIGVNLIPALAFPGRYRGFSEMLGVIPLGRPAWLVPLAYGLGTVTLILAGIIVFLLIRRKERKALASAAFLSFLYLSNFSILVAARSTTSDFSHIIRQFRYQLIPNALLVLLAAVIISALWSPTRKGRAILIAILLAVFSIN